MIIIIDIPIHSDIDIHMGLGYHNYNMIIIF